MVFHGSKWVLRVIHGSRSVFIVPGHFFMMPGQFSWVQVGSYGFSRFQVDFSWFQVVFHGFYDSRSGFHDSKWIFTVITRLV